MSNSETLLALVHPGVALLTGMLLVAVARFDRRQRYVQPFGQACLLYGVGILMQITVVPADVALNATISGLAFMAAALLFCRGLFLLGGRPPPWRTLGAICAAALLVRAYFTFLHLDGVLRAIALQLCIMLVLVIACWQVRHLRRGMHYERLLFWLISGLTASFGLRTLLLAERDTAQYGYDGSAYWITVQATFYAFNTLIALVLLMVAAGRAVNIIRQASFLDPLTRIYNRTGFHARMKDGLAGCERYGLISLDIDFFKSINDAHGHVVGDKVLAMLGGTLKRQLQSRDIVARYGGEEFLVFLPHADAAATYRTAETLRVAIERLDLSALGPDLCCTASVGACSFDASTPVQTAYGTVDALLYEAKSTGRNQTYGPQGRMSA